MKKLSFLILLACCILLTGCPLFYSDKLENHKSMTAEELTEYINSLDYGTTFTLIDSDFSQNKDTKTTTVYLKAQDLPEKTIRAYQHWCMYGGDIDSIARTTIPTYFDIYYCDYPFYKFENEITSYFEELYSPLVKNLEKNKEWKILIKPKMSTFFASKYDVSRDYETCEETLENTNYYIYLLINKELTSQTEREYNSFMYDLKQNVSDKRWFWDDFSCYYSTTYSAKTISDQTLSDPDFPSRTGVFIPDGE